MRKTIVMVAFTAALLSCSPRTSVPERFSAVTDTLSAGKHFALADLGGTEDALLITDYVYDDLEGHMATIMADVYATDPEGNVVDCGRVISQGTAYPLAVRDGRLFTAGHRFIQKYTLRNSNGKLMKAGDMLEVLDSLGEPLHYVIEGDMVCLPGDSLVQAKFDEWASYYNGLDLMPGKSFADFSRNGKRLFAKEDAAWLDRLTGVLFKCFEPTSVANATAALRRAKELGEPCPFTEESLNALFGTPLK